MVQYCKVSDQIIILLVFHTGTYCTDGELRLADGMTSSSGRVEICSRGYWGSMCGWRYDWGDYQYVSVFTNADAGVICKQLGYIAEEGWLIACHT